MEARALARIERVSSAMVAFTYGCYGFEGLGKKDGGRATREQGQTIILAICTNSYAQHRHHHENTMPMLILSVSEKKRGVSWYHPAVPTGRQCCSPPLLLQPA